jgi:hypothetical protein
MPLSVSTQVSPIGSILIQQTDSTEVPDNNITGAPATVLMVDVDNTANPAEDAYVKLYNNNAPNVGTTDPDWVLMIPQGVRRQMVITEGLEFSTGLSTATVTTGGTPGVTKLGSAVVIRMICL